MADQYLIGTVYGQPKISRTSTEYIRMDMKIIERDRPLGTDDFLLTLALHPRKARILAEALHRVLEEALERD